MIKSLKSRFSRKLRESSTRALTVFGESSGSKLVTSAAGGAVATPRVEGVVLQGTGASTVSLKATQRRQNFIAKLTIFLFVILPTLITGIYLGGYAVDQYQVETRFAPRSAEFKDPGSLGALVGLPSVGATSDSYLLVDFIRSADFVDQLDKEVGLKNIYSDKGDWLFRLSKDAPAEDVLKYWRDNVAVRVEASSQAVVVGVRAFSPEDAVKVANVILQKSESIVNSLSEQSRSEALAFAKKEVDAAEERLRQAREKMREYRSESTVLDPRGPIKAREELIGKMEAEISALNFEMRSLLGYLNDKAPSIVALRTRIAAMQSELTQLKSSTRSTAGGDANLADVIQNFERYSTEAGFAEKVYVTAMAAMERARVEADRRSKYLAVHVRPTKPESSTYPKRFWIVLATFVIALMAWGSCWLIYLGIRDHMH